MRLWLSLSIKDIQPAIPALQRPAGTGVAGLNAHSDPLVSVAWLRAHLDFPNVLAIDATWCMPGSAEPHPGVFIPGVRIDVDEVADKTSPLAHMLPSPEAFQTACRALGINTDTRIICYDRHGVQGAPRLWWMFRAMGHHNVSVLNGGLPAWIAGGGETVNQYQACTPGNMAAVLNLDLVKSIAQMRRVQAPCQLLDARPKGRFDGTAPEPRPGLSSGHMPGAFNVPFGSLKTDNGFLKSAPELAEIFGASGANLAAPIITSCGSGITACGIALALARLGVWDAAVYDGSWTEWASTPNIPIEKAS